MTQPTRRVRKPEPTTIPQDRWKWFGVAGHLCVGQWCRFHLCTQVGPWLVSTVGAYVHPRHSGSSELAEATWLQENWPGEDIGCDRKYETMVFRAGKSCKNSECNCGLPELGSFELDSEGYNTARDATLGHLKLCKRWAKRHKSYKT